MDVCTVIRTVTVETARYLDFYVYPIGGPSFVTIRIPEEPSHQSSNGNKIHLRLFVFYFQVYGCNIHRGRIGYTGMPDGKEGRGEEDGTEGIVLMKRVS